MFNNLKIISAGAGSGKTYRLTHEMAQLLASGTVRPTGIIATTFTRKAAAELQERVRVNLLAAGLSAQADELTNALIGTVHGLGVKLLKRFAFEAGVSPIVDILPDGDEQRLFNQSLSASLSMELIEEMDRLCDRLGLNKRDVRYDWRRQVRFMADLARANDFSLQDLEKSRARSWESFAAFLPEPDASLSEEAAYAQLMLLIEQTVADLDAGEDQTKATQEVAQLLREMRREYQLRGELPWYQWAKLGKLKTGARSREVIVPLQAFAARHEQMPAFQNDMRAFIEALFDTALAALREFASYKHRRGLIDYTDMEVLVNRLLDQKPVQDILREELDLLLVDEFQDTSPIQLDIFLKLSRLARHSIWVGDPKQSIYGFRGAEPRLMNAIIAAAGGIQPQNIQTQSWRSRPDLVDAVNAIFTKAFPDLPADQVALKPQRPEEADQSEALVHWHFSAEGDNKRPPGQPWMEDCIARSLHEWLATAPLVVPKDGSPKRPARPGDVAILCRSNQACEDMAAALHRAGLQAALARAQLLATAEACLTLACLKYLLNEEDSLSNAEIQLLASKKPLTDIVEDRLDYLDRNLEQGRYPLERWATDDPFIQKLNQLRALSAQLSSAEILNLVLEELDLRRIIVAWGQAEQRLSNIDQLRKMALQYEENCNNLHTAASLGGFLLWLGQMAIQAEDAQGASEDPMAVNVLTYHKSKGLEWPVVITHSLEQNLRAELWGLDLVADSPDVDLQQVLAGRWIRFWINPYSDQQKGTPLLERMEESAWQREKKAQALAEEVRLLYVGLTRARDYQIFPSRDAPTSWFNRVWNQGDEKIPTLDQHTHESPWHWNGRFLNKNTRIFIYPRDFPVAQPTEASTQAALFLDKRAGRQPHLPYLLDPEAYAAEQGLSFQAAETWQYGQAFERSAGVDISRWAAMLQQWMMADYSGLSTDEQEQRAQNWLRQFSGPAQERPPSSLTPARMAAHTQAWTAWLQAQWPVQPTRQLAVRYSHHNRFFEAIIDWVIELPEGYLIIQQTPFSADDTRQHARDMGPFMHLASCALHAATRKPVLGMYAHFPWWGRLVAVSQRK